MTIFSPKLYIGESKIICTVGTCFAVDYTAGWAWCNTHGLLLSYNCGAGVTLIVHFCCEFCAVNMDVLLFICIKEEQRTVICFLLAEGVPGAKMHRRMSAQYGNSVVLQQIAYEWRERLKNCRISIKHEEGGGCPSTSITGANTEQVHYVILQNRWVMLMKWHIKGKLVTTQPMKLFTVGLPSIKSVHNGSQSNSQNSTKRNVCISANGFWIPMVLKVTTSWKESSWEMKNGSTIMSQRVNTREWNGNIIIYPPRICSKCIQPQESSCFQFFGTHWGYYWNIIKRGVQQWKVFATVRCCVTS